MGDASYDGVTGALARSSAQFKGERSMRQLKFNSLSYLRKLLAQLKLLFRRKPEPEDPYAYRTALLRRPPHGKSGAAVAELDEE
jgi:hypothetical protein